MAKGFHVCRTFPGLWREAESSQILAGADGIASSSVLNKTESTPCSTEPTVLSEKSHSPVRARKLHTLHCSIFYIHMEIKHKSNISENTLECRSLSHHSNTGASTPSTSLNLQHSCSRVCTCKAATFQTTAATNTKEQTFNEVNI